MIELTKEEAIKRHRMLWNWIADETLRQKRFVTKREAFAHFGWPDILNHCWCCANKNLKELRAIYQYLPEYWEKLKQIQSKTDRPLKKYRNRKYGFYGSVFDLDRIFSEELSSQ